MPTIRDARRGPAVLATLSLILLALALTGCALIVEEPHAAGNSVQRTALASSTIPLPAYAVAVSAVDFDPPLKREASMDPSKPIKLLAAVENRGTMPLSRLSVEVRITNQRGDLTAHDRVQLDKLSPGETRVVEFRGAAPVSAIASQAPSYRVRVSVDGTQLDPDLPQPARELIVRVADQ